MVGLRPRLALSTSARHSEMKVAKEINVPDDYRSQKV